MTSKDSLGYPVEIGDTDSTPSDGRVSVSTIMTAVVGRACKMCRCPEQHTLKLKDPAGNTWEVTFPALVAGWVLALVQFPLYLIWNCAKARILRRLVKRRAPIPAGDAEWTPETDLVELEADGSPGPNGRAAAAALARATAPPPPAPAPPRPPPPYLDDKSPDTGSLKLRGWKMSFRKLHIILILNLIDIINLV